MLSESSFLFDLSELKAKDIIELPDEEGNYIFILPKMKLKSPQNPEKKIPIIVKFKPLRVIDEKNMLKESKKQKLSEISNDIILRYKHQITSINGNKDKFKTFKITCAGSDSPRVRGIAEYIQRTYGLTEKEESDMKIHIIKKLDEIWEIGVQITSRPLSSRDYKVKNMSGAMDSTIAYAVNSLCELENVDSYLNIFSGSATLLIEASQCYPNLKQLIGFDNNKKSISLAIQNIKKAGLIKKYS